MTNKNANIPTGKTEEYAVYTFEKRKPGQRVPERWEKLDVRFARNDALKQASRLFSSGRFLKVEVKYRYFDESLNRPVDGTLAVFERSKKEKWRKLAIFAVSAAGGVAAFALTYALAGDLIFLLWHR